MHIMRGSIQHGDQPGTSSGRAVSGAIVLSILMISSLISFRRHDEIDRSDMSARHCHLQSKRSLIDFIGFAAWRIDTSDG